MEIQKNLKLMLRYGVQELAKGEFSSIGQAQDLVESREIQAAVKREVKLLELGRKLYICFA